MVTNPPTTARPVLVRLATPADAPGMWDVTRRAFAARRPLDPPAAALEDTVDDVAQALQPPGFGVVAVVDDQLVGSLLVRLDQALEDDSPVEAKSSQIATLRRVGVAPGYRRLGVADAMVRLTLRGLADAGVRRARLLARAELPATIAWWRRRGFLVDHEVAHGYVMSANLPTPLTAETADDMRALGAQLARLLQPGDLIIASGELGAGKTVLAQGIGQGLGVDTPVISPTFVLARRHASSSGLGLVHVDAYRLGSAAELEDIDAVASLPQAVTYIEWGTGLAEGLSDERLEIHIERGEDDVRRAYLMPIGRRWREVEWGQLFNDDKEAE